MHEEEQKLADVEPDQTFLTSTGEEIKNLNQLLETLDGISEESFTHHVNTEKNDFANWVRNSIKDTELADIMEDTIEFEETKQVVKDRIDVLNKRIEVKNLKESLETLRSEPVVEEEISAPVAPVMTEAPANDTHPFEHLKHSMLHKTVYILIGMLIGLIIGYGVGTWG